MPVHRLPYAATGRFAPIVLDHVAGADRIREFRDYEPTLPGVERAAAQRTFPAEHRSALIAALRAQYRGLEPGTAVEANLRALAQEDSLTVTTGHQLCLFGGPLYVPFKLLNTIRLARTLGERLQRPVVPVFWMATEDHDRAEIDHVWFGDRRLHWPGKAGGAVGRMRLDGIGPVVVEACAALGPGPHAAEIAELLRACFAPERTLAEATRCFVHALFGRFGLVVVDGDDPALKRLAAPLFQSELLDNITQRTVAYADERLSLHYTVQAHARPINLFHLRPGHRSRIEATDTGFRVLDGGPSFTLDDLLRELEDHPEHFSPNVLLRPVYQETILPNVAYTGGGGELAYWLQLKWLFQAVRVPMPAVLLRSSAGFLPAKAARHLRGLGLGTVELFEPAHALRDRVAGAVGGTVSTDTEIARLETLYADLATRAAAIDPTLRATVEAAAVRATRSLHRVGDAMRRALRRREKERIARLENALSAFFPDGTLQERHISLLPMLATRGSGLLDELLETLDPLDARFTVYEEEDGVE